MLHTLKRIEVMKASRVRTQTRTRASRLCASSTKDLATEEEVYRQWDELELGSSKSKSSQVFTRSEAELLPHPQSKLIIVLHSEWQEHSVIDMFFNYCSRFYRAWRCTPQMRGKGAGQISQGVCESRSEAVASSDMPMNWNWFNFQNWFRAIKIRPRILRSSVRAREWGGRLWAQPGMALETEFTPR